MRSIKLEGVTKFKGGRPVVDLLSFKIPSHEFFALLGPSGCGKTTLLRLIAGFEKPDSGRILLGDKDITDLPSNKRKINVVFQNYALFPHLSVYGNVAYSLTIIGLSKKNIESKVSEVLKTFRLTDLAAKFPDQLSGGQQQRVAIARALANNPEVILLDEPLSATDNELRGELLVELIDIQAKLGMTFVYVTHDQSEALTVADYMGIMNNYGKIEQIGPPQEIYEHPRTSFVAKFVGRTNLFNGELTFSDGMAKINIHQLGAFNVHYTQDKPWAKEGSRLILSIRPEKILISRACPSQDAVDNVLQGKVSQIVYHGRSTEYHVSVNEQFKVHVFEQNEDRIAQEEIDYDHSVYLHWKRENASLLER